MSYAESARATFANMLGTLEHLVARAQRAGMDDSVLSVALTEDMFPLDLQVRVALNQVLLALRQVTVTAPPLEETAYRTFAEVRERIAAVRGMIETAGPADWVAADAPVDLTLPNGVRFLMTAEEDMRDWILPNFYFHVTMVYALLRQAGLAIGKMDFLPHMARHRAGHGLGHRAEHPARSPTA